MWYNDKVIVKQNPNFYTQEGYDHSSKGVNKIDKTEYIFEGNSGAWFESYEKKEPKIGDTRWIYDTEFVPWKVHPRSKYLFFTVYEVWWVPVQGNNTYEEIREFYAKNMLKVSLPSSLNVRSNAGGTENKN